MDTLERSADLAPSAAAAPPLPEGQAEQALVMHFESLGGSGHGCEFGLFQRHFGAEPLGLLRWADLGPDLLMSALENRFEGVGAPENTIVFQPDGSDEWWTRDTRYWMAMRSFIKTADVNFEQMTGQARRRLEFLRRKMIGDLEAGEKLFVYKNMFRNLTDAEVARLHAAVRSYGDTTLFYVRYEDAAHPFGTVEEPAPGLFIGYIDRFAHSPQDKPLGPATTSWYTLCDRAWGLYEAGGNTAVPEPAPDPAPAPRRPAPARTPRRVVLVGNCQMQAMTQLYKRFVAPRTGDQLTYIQSYQELSAESRTAIEQADLFVEQLFDLKQEADFAGISTSAERLFIPMVTGGFLWPFAGQAHPKNAGVPFLPGGPYGGEASDSYLNRLIAAGVEPEEAVETYTNLDVRKRMNLDRLFELVMDRQRSRDELAGYDIAGLIEQHFRTEQVFLSPYHPNRRIAVALATRFFEQMGADRSDVDLMTRRTRITPFPKGELPIHPAVQRHFGLEYVAPDRRYRFMNEGFFTFREYALRYMRYEWNETLEEGMSLVHAGKMDEARAPLTAGIALDPQTAAGHHALSHVLRHQGHLNDAVAMAERAVAIEPDAAPYHASLGALFRQLGRLDDADRAYRTAIETDPSEPHYLTLAAHLAHARKDPVRAAELIRQAVTLDPYSAGLYQDLANYEEARGDLAAAAAALREAVTLKPASASVHRRMAHLFERAGDTEAAEAAARTAVTLDPADTGNRIALSDLLLRRGDRQEALNEAYIAAARDPDSAPAYAHLGHVLQMNEDRAAEHAFRRAARLDPRNAHFRYQLSYFLLRHDRFDESVAAAREAVAIDPANPRRYSHTAYVLAAAGDVPAAEAEQRRAVELAPTDVECRILLSDLLARQGRLDEALAEARLATAQNPDNPRGPKHLAHILRLMGRAD